MQEHNDFYSAENRQIEQEKQEKAEQSRAQRLLEIAAFNEHIATESQIKSI